jgi:hypothetical protein
MALAIPIRGKFSDAKGYPTHNFSAYQHLYYIIVITGQNSVTSEVIYHSKKSHSVVFLKPLYNVRIRCDNTIILFRKYRHPN